MRRMPSKTEINQCAFAVAKNRRAEYNRICGILRNAGRFYQKTPCAQTCKKIERIPNSDFGIAKIKQIEKDFFNG